MINVNIDHPIQMPANFIFSDYPRYTWFFYKHMTHVIVDLNDDEVAMYMAEPGVPFRPSPHDRVYSGKNDDY